MPQKPIFFIYQLDNLFPIYLPLPGVQVIADQTETGLGEILIKCAGICEGYITEGKVTPIELQEGWLPSGDLGYIDQSGFLFVVGRSRNTFKNSYAHFIAPEPIERAIRAFPGVDQCMVLGSNREFNSALIRPDFDWLRTWCDEHDVHWTSEEYMLFNPDVTELYNEVIEHINSSLPGHEHIGGFALVHEEWDEQTGLATATLKIRRDRLLNFYEKTIENIYKP